MPVVKCIGHQNGPGELSWLFHQSPEHFIVETVMPVGTIQGDAGYMPSRSSRRILGSVVIINVGVWSHYLLICNVSGRFPDLTARSVSEKALLAHFFVIGRKLMLAILTIWLCLISGQCLELNQNGNSPTHSRSVIVRSFCKWPRTDPEPARGNYCGK